MVFFNLVKFLREKFSKKLRRNIRGLLCKILSYYFIYSIEKTGTGLLQRGEGLLLAFEANSKHSC